MPFEDGEHLTYICLLFIFWMVWLDFFPGCQRMQSLLFSEALWHGGLRSWFLELGFPDLDLRSITY